MQSQEILVNNQLISYSEQGTAGQMCLLFLHGWRSNKEVWGLVIDRVANKTANNPLKIYAMDLPGFGKSEMPKQTMTVEDYAKSVNAFIEKLGLKNVVVIGHSFGGRVGIKLASNYRSAITKLVLVDSAGFTMASAKKALIKSAAKIVKPLFKPKFMQPLRNKIYQTIGSEDYLATPELTQTYLNVVAEDLTEDLKNIIQPTLIIFGDEDTATPKTYGEKMNSLIPNSRLQILSKAGHFSFLDQPEEFSVSLLKFLGQQPKL